MYFLRAKICTMQPTHRRHALQGETIQIPCEPVDWQSPSCTEIAAPQDRPRFEDLDLQKRPPMPFGEIKTVSMLPSGE